MMPDNHRIQLCLDALYATLTNPTMWPEAINSIKELTRAASATFALIGKDNNNKIMGDALDGTIAAEWENYYCHLDPRRSIARLSAVGSWIIDDRLLDPYHSPSLEYVNDFARRAGLRWSRGGKIYEGNAGFATLALHRPANTKPFDDHLIIATLDYLLPHVQRVARLAFGPEKSLFDISAGTAITDFLDLPVGIVNRECKLIYMNRAAEKLLTTQQWLSSDNQRLQITNSAADQAVLRNGVAKACASCGRVASVIRIRSQFFLHFLLFKIVPLFPESFQSFTSEPTALIVVEGVPRAANAADLQCLFGLTVAEAELLSLLSTGCTVEECAQRRGVRISTSRTQMQSIFTKAGVSRQSELMRLLADVGLIFTV